MVKRNRRTCKNSHTRRRKRRTRRTRRKQRRRRTRKHRGAGWEKKVFGKDKVINPYYKGYRTITYAFRKPGKFIRQFPGKGTAIGQRRALRRWKKEHPQTP